MPWSSSTRFLSLALSRHREREWTEVSELDLPERAGLVAVAVKENAPRLSVRNIFAAANAQAGRVRVREFLTRYHRDDFHGRQFVDLCRARPPRGSVGFSRHTLSIHRCEREN
jgi:hypothetical protein